MDGKIVFKIILKKYFIFSKLLLPTQINKGAMFTFQG